MSTTATVPAALPIFAPELPGATVARITLALRLARQPGGLLCSQDFGRAVAMVAAAAGAPQLITPEGDGVRITVGQGIGPSCLHCGRETADLCEHSGACRKCCRCGSCR